MHTQEFSEEAPVRPDTVFIDTQVKLMKAAHIDTWGVFFAVQFFKTIENGFALGTSKVVLAFDNYKYVPASKTMTQVKRAKQRLSSSLRKLRVCHRKCQRTGEVPW